MCNLVKEAKGYYSSHNVLVRPKKLEIETTRVTSETQGRFEVLETGLSHISESTGVLGAGTELRKRCASVMDSCICCRVFSSGLYAEVNGCCGGLGVIVSGVRLQAH